MNLTDSIYGSLKREFELRGDLLVWDDSETAIKLKVIASEIARLTEKAEFYEAQLFPATASNEYLEKHGEAKGILRKPATKSKGYVTFYCKGTPAADILIPAGTTLSSSKADMIFHTTEDITIAAGEISGEAAVESEETGKKANIAPGYIDTIVTPITGIERAENLAIIIGGTDKEDDESYRARVVEGYRKLTNGANLSYYEEFSKKVEDICYAKAVFNAEVPNEIFLYVQNFERTITADTILKLQTEIDKVKEAGVSVVVKKPTSKSVSCTVFVGINNLSNADFYKEKAQSLISRSIQSLPIGARFSPAKTSRDLLSEEGILDLRFVSPTVPVSVPADGIADVGLITVNVERVGG